MTYENNIKYIAETWIDNKEEEDFKTSFLTSLIQQWQGHGNEFDADTVDTKHYTDILKDIKSATKDCMKEFYIGYTYFSVHKDISQYFLGFEAVKLYNPDETSEFFSSDEEKTLPWGTEPITDESEIPNLLQAFKELYDLTYMGVHGSGKTNRELYNNLLDGLNNVDERLSEMEENILPRFKDGLLNADSINGIRFFIYTPAQYADLKEKDRLYELYIDNDEEEIDDAIIEAHKKLHSVHNVFIIKSTEEIIESGYEDGIYPNNPDTAIINKYYQFRVEENTKILQYKHADSDVWLDLCSASNFIDEDTIRDLVEKVTPDFLEREDEYLLNKISLKNSLNSFNTNDFLSLPIAQYNKQTYITGGIYDYHSDDNKKILPNRTLQGFQYLDLTNLERELETQINDVQSDLTDFKGIENSHYSENKGSIGTINVTVDGIQGNITELKGGSDLTIKELENKIASLETQYANLTTWKRVQTWNDGENDFAYLDVIEPLRIARIVFTYFSLYKNSPSDWQLGWSHVYHNSNKTRQALSAVNNSYIPGHDLYFSTNTHKVIVCIQGKASTSTPGYITYKTYDLDVAKGQKDSSGSHYFDYSFKGIYKY